MDLAFNIYSNIIHMCKYKMYANEFLKDFDNPISHRKEQ